jgi:hypothetical protein
MSGTIGTWTPYPSGAPSFKGIRVAQSLVFCLPLLVYLSTFPLGIVLRVFLQIPAFDYFFVI